MEPTNCSWGQDKLHVRSVDDANRNLYNSIAIKIKSVKSEDEGGWFVKIKNGDNRATSARWVVNLNLPEPLQNITSPMMIIPQQKGQLSSFRHFFCRFAASHNHHFLMVLDCFFENTIFRGSSHQRSEKASTFMECQGLCQRVNNCFHWTFVRRTELCYLIGTSFGWNRKKIKNLSKQSKNGTREDFNTMSGPQFCPSCFRKERNIVYNSNKTNFESIWDCQKACYHMENCEGFSAEIQTGKCYFKEKQQEKRQQKLRKGDFISGPKVCDIGECIMFSISVFCTVYIFVQCSFTRNNKITLGRLVSLQRLLSRGSMRPARGSQVSGENLPGEAWILLSWKQVPVGTVQSP